MTMNWYVAESLIAERNLALRQADARRWPEVGHARRTGHGTRVGGERFTVRRNPAQPSLPSRPSHRWANFLRGMAAGTPVAPR